MAMHIHRLKDVSVPPPEDSGDDKKVMIQVRDYLHELLNYARAREGLEPHPHPDAPEEADEPETDRDTRSRLGVHDGEFEEGDEEASARKEGTRAFEDGKEEYPPEDMPEHLHGFFRSGYDMARTRDRESPEPGVGDPQHRHAVGTGPHNAQMDHRIPPDDELPAGFVPVVREQERLAADAAATIQLTEGQPNQGTQASLTGGPGLLADERNNEAEQTNLANQERERSEQRAAAAGEHEDEHHD